MKYFVTSVQTYCTTGKTKKGALLQAVANRFEGCIIADDDALVRMKRDIKALVAAVNKAYKGKPLSVASGQGWICVKPEYNGNDNHVFSIYYKPVAVAHTVSTVSQQIFDVVYNIARDIAKEYRKEAHYGQA